MLRLPFCELRAGGHSFLPAPLRCLAGRELLRQLSRAFLQKREEVAGGRWDAAQGEGGHDFQELPPLRFTGCWAWEAAGLKAEPAAASPLLLPAHGGTWSREPKDRLGAILHASERSSQPRSRTDFLSPAEAHASVLHLIGEPCKGGAGRAWAQPVP